MSLVQVHRRFAALLACCTVAVAACGGDAARGGVLVISAAGDADVLFPPTEGRQQSQQVTDLLFDRLADIGPELNTLGDGGFTPRLATRWEWSRDSMAVTFHLDPRARWHDSVPVRASDVRFAYAVYTDPAVAASDGAPMREVVDSLAVGDSVTFTVWYKRRSPERFYAIAYNLIPLPEHLLAKIPRDSLGTSAFTRRPVGDGPYRFVRWDQSQRIELAASSDYYRGRPNIDRVIWTIVPDGQTAAERVFHGDADVIYSLTSAQAAEISKHPELRGVHLGSTTYTFLLFNIRDGASGKPHPLFNDRALRRALSMAVDKQSIVTNLLDSLGRQAYGPFAKAQWSADTTLRQIPFDPAASAKLLDSLGWVPGKDGVRARSGRRLAFTILLPGSSLPRQRLAVLLQEQWRQIGAQVKIENADFAAYSAKTHNGTFDATLSGLTPAPSPNGLRQNWSTAALGMSNGMNLGHYADPKLDAEIDSALNATTLASGRAHYRAAYQALLDAAPAIWLFEPVVVGGFNKRVTTGPLRPDAWWASIPNWRVSGKPASRDSSTRQP